MQYIRLSWRATADSHLRLQIPVAEHPREHSAASNLPPNQSGAQYLQLLPDLQLTSGPQSTRFSYQFPCRFWAHPQQNNAADAATYDPACFSTLGSRKLGDPTSTLFITGCGTRFNTNPW